MLKSTERDREKTMADGTEEREEARKRRELEEREDRQGLTGWIGWNGSGGMKVSQSAEDRKCSGGLLIQVKETIDPNRKDAGCRKARYASRWAE